MVLTELRLRITLKFLQFYTRLFEHHLNYFVPCRLFERSDTELLLIATEVQGVIADSLVLVTSYTFCVFRPVSTVLTKINLVALYLVPRNDSTNKLYSPVVVTNIKRITINLCTNTETVKDVNKSRSDVRSSSVILTRSFLPHTQAHIHTPSHSLFYSVCICVSYSFIRVCLSL